MDISTIFQTFISSIGDLLATGLEATLYLSAIFAFIFLFIIAQDLIKRG